MNRRRAMPALVSLANSAAMPSVGRAANSATQQSDSAIAAWSDTAPYGSSA
jgi:hypothetical protein